MGQRPRPLAAVPVAAVLVAAGRTGASRHAATVPDAATTATVTTPTAAAAASSTSRAVAAAATTVAVTVTATPAPTTTVLAEEVQSFEADRGYETVPVPVAMEIPAIAVVSDYGTGRDDLVAALPSPEAGPEDRLLDAELKGYVADAVAALPDRMRAAVVGYVCEGRPMKELAAELSVTESRVSQLCTEAIALLRDGINAQLDPALVSDRDVVTGRVSRRKAAYCNAVATASRTADRLDRRIPTAA